MSVNCPQGKLRPCPDMNVWDCWEEWGGNRGQSEVHANKINYSFFEVIKKIIMSMEKKSKWVFEMDRDKGFTKQ